MAAELANFALSTLMTMKLSISMSVPVRIPLHTVIRYRAVHAHAGTFLMFAPLLPLDHPLCNNLCIWIRFCNRAVQAKPDRIEEGGLGRGFAVISHDRQEDLGRSFPHSCFPAAPFQ